MLRSAGTLESLVLDWCLERKAWRKARRKAWRESTAKDAKVAPSPHTRKDAPVKLTHVVKDGYTIKEAMEIYGLTVDTLYYYESKGLISPKRNPENGYRLFGAEDFYRLNIITELRDMGFDLDSIRDYFNNHTMAATLQLLNHELASIDRDLERLRAAKSNVTGSMQRYANAISAAQSECVAIQHVPARTCLLVSEDLIYYTDIPYLFAKRTREQHATMGTMHSTPCYVVDQNVIQENGCFAPRAILLYSETEHFENGFVLAGGLYASCTFKGSLDVAPRIYARVLEYLESQGYEECGSLVEFCLIGEYESHDRNEYVNRIEVPVRPKA